MIRAVGDVLKQIMTLEDTTAAAEKKHVPTEQELMQWEADDVLRPYDFRVPVEGDPFALEQVVLAEVVDEA